MKISMIVAYGNNRELGLNNELLWHIPEDLKKFKEITTGNYLMMGRKTYESIFAYLNKPLPNRNSIVLTSSKKEYPYDNVFNATNFSEAIEIAKKEGAEEIIIIGGATVYKDLFHYVHTLYLSEVDFDGEADCFFEHKINLNEWNVVKEESYKPTENTPAWTFKELNKKQ